MRLYTNLIEYCNDCPNSFQATYLGIGTETTCLLLEKHICTTIKKKVKIPDWCQLDYFDDKAVR